MWWVFQLLGYFFPSVAADNWIWKIAHIAVIHLSLPLIGSIDLGNMDVGLNTQNLSGIVIIILLTAVNILGLKTGAMVQNIFTIANVSALAGLILVAVFVGPNAQAVAANVVDL